jgi:hypothetical protein
MQLSLHMQLLLHRQLLLHLQVSLQLGLLQLVFAPLQSLVVVVELPVSQLTSLQLTLISFTVDSVTFVTGVESVGLVGTGTGTVESIGVVEVAGTVGTAGTAGTAGTVGTVGTADMAGTVVTGCTFAGQFDCPKINRLSVVFTPNNLCKPIPKVKRHIRLIINPVPKNIDVTIAPTTVKTTSTSARPKNLLECMPSPGFPKISL